jgi:hypothetical protein
VRLRGVHAVSVASDLETVGALAIITTRMQGVVAESATLMACRALKSGCPERSSRRGS